MTSNERVDLCEDRFLHHGNDVSRVITRMSTMNTGNHTILRAFTREPIQHDMESYPALDMEKLKADMAAYVERKSGRKLSLAASAGKNPDFYRNFIGGQDKRLTADVFMRIVDVLGKNPADYFDGLDPRTSLPNATVLTSTFAMLLDSLGVAPYEGELAQKLAQQFPNALKSVASLHGAPAGERGAPRGEDQIADAAGRRSV